MTTPWQEWLEKEIKKRRSANALANEWGLQSSYLARWRNGQLPERYRLPMFAEKSNTPMEEMERIYAASETMKSEQRRQRLLQVGIALQLLLLTSRPCPSTPLAAVRRPRAA